MSGQLVCFLTPSLAFQRRCRAVVLFFFQCASATTLPRGCLSLDLSDDSFPRALSGISLLRGQWCSSLSSLPPSSPLFISLMPFIHALWGHISISKAWHAKIKRISPLFPIPNHSTIQTHAMLSAIWACRGIVNTTYFHYKTCLLLILFASKQTPYYPSVMTQGYNK